MQIFLMPVQIMELKPEDTYWTIHLAVQVSSHSQVSPRAFNPTWF